MRDPESPAEWQEAIDWAAYLLALEAARQYGLVTGGPAIDEARCLELLRRGRRKGLAPRADHVERCTWALKAAEVAPRCP